MASDGKSLKHIPAILTDRRGERSTVSGIKFNESTGKLPEVIRHDERNFAIDHNPAGNAGPLNPPIYREVDTQQIGQSSQAMRD